MAVAVDFRKFEPVDSREDLLRKVREAPAKHAEAILAAYEVLEKLHEKDVLQLLNGLLGARDTIVDHVADLVSSKEMVNLLRLALLFGSLAKNIDPDALHATLTDVKKDPPSLLKIAKQASSEDARVAMGLLVGVLGAFGRALRKSEG